MTRKRLLATVIVSAAAVGAFALAAMWAVASVYVMKGDSPAIRRLAFLFPVARVGGERVMYDAFLRRRDALRAFVSAQAAAQGQASDPAAAAFFEESTYRQLVREAAVRNETTSRHISVTDADVRAAYDELLRSSSSTEDALAAYIRDTFRWSPDEFRREMLGPQLLEERLSAGFTTSTDYRDREAAVSDFVEQRLREPDVKLYLHFPTQALASP